MNVANEVLNSFQGATKDLLGFFMANADKEILSEVSAALGSKKCGLVVEINTQAPFGVALKVVGNDGDILLLTLIGEDVVFN